MIRGFVALLQGLAGAGMDWKYNGASIGCSLEEAQNAREALFVIGASPVFDETNGGILL